MLYKKAFEWIKKAQDIVLISHINPDGDALGSVLAMYHVLKRMNKNVTAVNTTKALPKILDFLPGYSEIKSVMPEKFDLIISFDSGNFYRLGIEDKKDAKIINIDHHDSNTAYGDLNIIEPRAVSSSVIAFEFFKRNSLPIPKESALCIYVGIVTDTGFFKYEDVNKNVFLTAAELVDLGVDPHYVGKMLNEREPLSKLKLAAKILDTLDVFLDGKVAVLRLTQKMLKDAGATVDQAENIANMARNMATVEVGILLREEPDGRTKVSLRSKNYVDVSKIAIDFGGGGHKRAAGFKSDIKDYKIVREKLLNALKKVI
jgi:phosphoesterase RecJ-like protein